MPSPMDNEPPVSREPPAQTSPISGGVPIEAIVGRARRAAGFWAKLPVRERLRWLLAYRDRLLDAIEEIIETVGREVDKPRFDVAGEVFQSCQLIGYLARNAPRLLRSRKVRPWLLFNKAAEIRYRPMGVVGIITPWNYPVVLVVSPVVQALAAGNAVVLKPSEHATATAQLLHRLFLETAVKLGGAAGSPLDLWQLALGGPEAAIALAGAGVDKVAFTGGRRGGTAVAQAAAGRLTPVLLELGGKDAMIVAADADIERAAHAAVWGAFLNAGQSCIAVERCYVEESVAHPFLARVLDLTARLTTPGATAPNGPAAPDVEVGPLRTQQQLEHVRQLVEEAIAAGARVLAGGLPSEDQARRRLFPPTVLTEVHHGMRLLHEETFGPVLPIVRVPSVDAAMDLANDSRYGLAASLWTRDVRRARELATQLHVGGVVINDCLVHFACTELPFGGTKESGFGRTHGPEGLREYCATQTILRHQFGLRREFQWFPYGTKHHLVTRLARLLFRSGWRHKLR